ASSDIIGRLHDNGVKEDEMREGLGPLGRKPSQHITAHTVTAADERVAVEEIQQRQQRIRIGSPVRKGLGLVAATMPALIGRNDMRACRQGGDDLIPEPRMKAGCMEQEQGQPLARCSPFVPADVAAWGCQPLFPGRGAHAQFLGPSTSRMLSSFSCFSLTGAGAPIIRSSAFWFIGKTTTSRILGSSARSITMRSTPGAEPPCGGAPNLNALIMPLKLASTSAWLYPAISNALYMMSGRWFRIAPDDSSTPLQTRSYCQARISSGSLVSSASSSPCGMLKGLWLKSILPVSSSASNMGKSTIQHMAKRFVSISSSCSATRVRARPASFASTASLPAAKKSPSSGPRPSSAASASILSVPWFLAIGPPHSPPLRVAYPRPAKPSPCAQLFISSKNLRLFSAVPGAGMARTTSRAA